MGIGLSILTLRSIVPYPAPASSIVCTAHPVTESNTVAAKPPWTPPIGLRWRSSAVARNLIAPLRASTNTMGQVSAIEGRGNSPLIIACMISSPENLAKFSSDNLLIPPANRNNDTNGHPNGLKEAASKKRPQKSLAFEAISAKGRIVQCGSGAGSSPAARASSTRSSQMNSSLSRASAGMSS